MAIRIDGKAVSAQVRARVAGEVAALREKGVVPGLAVIIVGDDPASRVYVNNKKKACAEVGIRSEEFALPADTTQLQLMALVHQLNERKDISGILCQLPLQSIWKKSRSSRPLLRRKMWMRSIPPMWGVL